MFVHIIILCYACIAPHPQHHHTHVFIGQVRGKHVPLPFGMLADAGSGGASAAEPSAPASPDAGGGGGGGGSEEGAGDKRKPRKRAASEDAPATLADLAAEWIATLSSRRERKSTLLFSAEVGGWVTVVLVVRLCVYVCVCVCLYVRVCVCLLYVRVCVSAPRFGVLC